MSETVPIVVLKPVRKKLSSIWIPGKRHADHVLGESLLESMRQDGVFSALVVSRDGALVAGYDRYRALKSAGEKYAWCFVPPAGANLRRIQIAENLHRKHLPTAELATMRKELVAIERLAVADGDGEREGKRGRPPSAEAEARRRAAKATGVSERTMRRATGKKKPSDAPEMEPMRTAVLEVGRAARAAVGFLSRARRAVDEAASQMERTAGSDGVYSTAIASLRELRSSFDAAGVRLARLHFVALCAYCGGKKADCSCCGGTGVMTKDQARDVPEHLRVGAK